MQSVLKRADCIAQWRRWRLKCASLWSLCWTFFRVTWAQGGTDVLLLISFMATSESSTKTWIGLSSRNGRPSVGVERLYSRRFKWRLDGDCGACVKNGAWCKWISCQTLMSALCCLVTPRRWMAVVCNVWCSCLAPRYVALSIRHTTLTMFIFKWNVCECRCRLEWAVLLSTYTLFLVNSIALLIALFTCALSCVFIYLCIIHSVTIIIIKYYYYHLSVYLFIVLSIYE